MKFPFRFLFFNWSRREKERKEERKKEYELIFFPPVFFVFGAKVEWPFAQRTRTNQQSEMIYTSVWPAAGWLLSFQDRLRLVLWGKESQRNAETASNFSNSIYYWRIIQISQREKTKKGFQMIFKLAGKRPQNESEMILNLLWMPWNQSEMTSN